MGARALGFESDGFRGDFGMTGLCRSCPRIGRGGIVGDWRGLRGGFGGGQKRQGMPAATLVGAEAKNVHPEAVGGKRHN